MKNLNMDVYSVEAMSKQEMQNENGGGEPGYGLGYYTRKVCGAVGDFLSEMFYSPYNMSVNGAAGHAIMGSK